MTRDKLGSYGTSRNTQLWRVGKLMQTYMNMQGSAIVYGAQSLQTLE